MGWTDKTIHEGEHLGKRYRIKLAGGEVPYVQVWERYPGVWRTSTDIDTTLLFYRAALVALAALVPLRVETR